MSQCKFCHYYDETDDVAHQGVCYLNGPTPQALVIPRMGESGPTFELKAVSLDREVKATRLACKDYDAKFGRSQ